MRHSYSVLTILFALLVNHTSPLVYPSHAQTIRYQDEAGNIFFAEKLSDIPPQYRSQVVKPTPLPYTNEREKRAWERQQARLEAAQEREARRDRPRLKSRKLGKEPHDDDHEDGDIKQIQTVEIFVSPQCEECPKLEKFLRNNRIKFKSYDIVKSQKAFQMFDQLGAGTRLPVTRIGKRIIKGIQPDAILDAATNLSSKKEEDENGLGSL